LTSLFCAIGTPGAAPPRVEAAVRRLGEGSAEPLREVTPADGIFAAGDASTLRSVVADDLIVLVTGHPRVVRDHGAGAGAAVSEPVDVAGIAALWQARGPDGLATLTSNFAIIVIEPRRGAVHLHVDPLGHGSLFVRVREGMTYISTEVAPLLELGTDNACDAAALGDVFNCRFLSGTRTLWQGVRQVVPGYLLSMDGGAEPKERKVHRVAYDPGTSYMDLGTAAARTSAALAQAFAQRRDEGVAHAAVLLSGGMDSSIMAALAARSFPRCTAFTARIDGYENPELPRAIEVARRLGIEHRVVDVVDDDVERLFPHVMDRLQEPPRHFNNVVVARLYEEVRRDADFVVLGDSADALFGGGALHTVHGLARKCTRLRVVPGPVRRAGAHLLRGSRRRRARALGNLLRYDLAELLMMIDGIPRTPEASALLRPVVERRTLSDDIVRHHYPRGRGPIESFQEWRLGVFLACILRRNARLLGAAGLHGWYPFMEPGVLRIATGLPTALKFDPELGGSKPTLRAVCEGLVGEDVANWSKMGFPSPEREWMLGPLRPILERAMSDDALLGRFFEPAGIRALPLERNHQTLWTLMTLEEALRAG
jgi:asparagine synthase (glutamine-hydrolysing)